MNVSEAPLSALWPLAVYFAAVVGLLTIILTLSYFLGQRHRQMATAEPFESGIVSVGSARLRFPAKFYLVAVFFVIFDVESVFLFAWAIALRESGWPGFVEGLVFVLILIGALVYLWRLGALDWGAAKERSARLIP